MTALDMRKGLGLDPQPLRTHLCSPQQSPKFDAVPDRTTAPRQSAPSALRRYLVGLHRAGEVASWADFSDAVRRCDPAAHDRVADRVLDTLTPLGLTASVWSLDGPSALAEHDPETAGHVLVHALGLPAEWPVRDTGRGAHERTHERRMFEQHELLPVPGLGADLRGFCGQADTDGRGRPRWLDHARTWVDRWGDPVLTAEPYADALDVRALVDDVASLPIEVRREAGVRNDATVLLVIRLDPEGEPLAAVRPPEPDPLGDDRTEFDELVLRLMRAEHVATDALRTSTSPLTRSVIGGILARAVASRGDAITWAETRLAAGVLSGQLDQDTFVTLVERLHAACPSYGTPSSLTAVVSAALTRAWSAAYTAAAPQVSTEFGQDFAARVGALVARHPQVARAEPLLLVARQWLVELAAQGAAA